MPSDRIETIMLGAVMVLLLLSVPLMAALRPRQAAAPDPADGPLPPPVPLEFLPLHRWWERPDAWFAGVMTVLIVLLMGPHATRPPTNEDGAPSLSLSPSMLVAQLVFQLGIASMVWGFLTVVRRYPVTRLWGLFRRGIGRTILDAVIWIVPGAFVIRILSGVMVLALKAMGVNLEPQAVVTAARAVEDPLTLWLLAATLAIGAPVMEEIVFRGLLYSTARRWFPRWYALVASSLFFAVVHGNALSLLPLTLLGGLFAVAYDVTRNLAVPMLMHALFNFTQYLLLRHAPDLPF